LKNHFSSFYVIDLLKKQMPLNIMKEQSLTYKKTTFALYKDKICLASLLSDLITTLTYVLMDNFCPCFNIPKVVRTVVIITKYLPVTEDLSGA
jgi:hypothetical protein